MRDVRIGPFNNPYGARQLIYWAALSFWGYKVTAPGAYTITAIPKNFTAVSSNGPNADQRFSFAENSNSIKIQVVPVTRARCAGFRASDRDSSRERR